MLDKMLEASIYNIKIYINEFVYGFEYNISFLFYIISVIFYKFILRKVYTSILYNYI